MAEPKYPEIVVELTDVDGNAFAILAHVRRAMRKGGVPNEEVDAFLSTAMEGDYDNLLQTCMEWVNIQ